jgi:hypothetical protein
MPPDVMAIASLARRAAREPLASGIEAPDPVEAERGVTIMGGRIREWGGAQADPLVEVRGAGEMLLVPVSVLEAWFRADRGPRTLGLGLLRPDESAQRRGATAVVFLHYSAGGTAEIKRLGLLATFFWRLRHRLGLH